MKQREEHFLLHKGSEKKKREERSSQEVMNITLFFVLSIKLPNSQNSHVQIIFPMKTSEGSQISVWIDSREDGVQPRSQTEKWDHKKVMPQELSEIVEMILIVITVESNILVMQTSEKTEEPATGFQKGSDHFGTRREYPGGKHQRRLHKEVIFEVGLESHSKCKEKS